MSDPFIEIRNVSKTFGGGMFRGPGVASVEGVSLAVPRGQTLGIVGESGSGKSTLLRIVLGLTRPCAGQVLIGGQDIASLRGTALRDFRRRVQPVFQNPASSFNPRQTIRAILRAPLEVHGIGTGRERDARIDALLGHVGLGPEFAERLPHQLSGGQKQRVAIARAIILDPQVVLADEPTSALDVSVQAQVLRLFARIQAELGLTTLFVSHNLAVIRQVSHQVAVMQHGRLVEFGPAEQVFRAPREDYTRRLIAAVPDPRHAFTRKEALA